MPGTQITQLRAQDQKGGRVGRPPGKPLQLSLKENTRHALDVCVARRHVDTPLGASPHPPSPETSAGSLPQPPAWRPRPSRTLATALSGPQAPPPAHADFLTQLPPCSQADGTSLKSHPGRPLPALHTGPCAHAPPLQTPLPQSPAAPGFSLTPNPPPPSRTQPLNRGRPGWGSWEAGPPHGPSAQEPLPWGPQSSRPGGHRPDRFGPAGNLPQREGREDGEGQGLPTGN